MANSHSVFASLIIPTYRREKSLVDCLQCATAQDYTPLEILVIDQTEKHEPSTIAFLDHIRDRVRLIRLAPPSIVTARNHGLREAKGDVLIFVDDDTTFAPNFVSEHVKAHAAGADVVQGRVIEPGRGVSHRAQKMLPWLRVVGSNTYDQSGITNTLTGCNFSLSRKAARQVGEFDTLFTGPLIREDADYGARCHKLGLRMVFHAPACLTHYRDAVGGVDAEVKAAARVFEPGVLRNELYFARKHFPALVVWQYKLRIARRIKRAIKKTGTYPEKPITQLLRDADREAKALLKRHFQNINH